MKLVAQILMALVCLLGTSARNLPAQELSPPSPPSATPNAAPSDKAKQAAEELSKDERKQKAVTLGLMILFCIALTGLGLLAVVIIWGHRVRRISRKPLPAAPRGDDLFYLKNDKQQKANPIENTTVIPPPPEDGFDIE